MLGVFKIRLEPKVPFDLWTDSFARFNLAQLIDRLCVVRDWPEAIDGDGHRSHAQETERDQAESEDRRCKSELSGHQLQQRVMLGELVADQHQSEDGEPLPERGEVPCDKAGQNV